jgi:hypothetical protein
MGKIFLLGGKYYPSEAVSSLLKCGKCLNSLWLKNGIVIARAMRKQLGFHPASRSRGLGKMSGER